MFLSAPFSEISPHDVKLVSRMGYCEYRSHVKPAAGRRFAIFVCLMSEEIIIITLAARIPENTHTPLLPISRDKPQRIPRDCRSHY